MNILYLCTSGGCRLRFILSLRASYWVRPLKKQTTKVNNVESAIFISKLLPTCNDVLIQNEKTFAFEVDHCCFFLTYTKYFIFLSEFFTCIFFIATILIRSKHSFLFCSAVSTIFIYLPKEGMMFDAVLPQMFTRWLPGQYKCIIIFFLLKNKTKLTRAAIDRHVFIFDKFQNIHLHFYPKQTNGISFP